MLMLGVVYCSNIEAAGDVYSEDDGGDAHLLSLLDLIRIQNTVPPPEVGAYS